MKAFVLALTVFAALGPLDRDEARAQSPRNKPGSANTGNPLMPNLGVPYTDMQMARSMLYRGTGNRNRGRNRHRHRPAHNAYRGAGRLAPF